MSNDTAKTGGITRESERAMLTPIGREVIARAQAGETSRQISDDLKRRGIKGWGLATTGNFLRAHIGARRAGRPRTPDVALPSSDTEVPPPEDVELLEKLVKSESSAAGVVASTSSLDALQWLYAFVHRHMLDAERVGNLAMIATLSTRAIAIQDAIRKATPEPPPDPNLNPDFIKMAEIAEERLMRIIASLAGER